MIIEGDDYETVYFDERDGFRCEIIGRKHEDRGNGWGLTKNEAFDIAMSAYRTNRENRENDFVEKKRVGSYQVN